MKIQIKARFTNSILFEGSFESTKEAIVKAVSNNANLRNADLSGLGKRFICRLYSRSNP